MDRQEWFERFKANLHYEEDQFYGHLWIEERWKIIQFAFIKMSIHQLPSPERRVVKLIFFDGLSERDAAAAMKLPKTKVHRIKLSALKLLERSVYVKLALSPWQLRTLESRV